jgi:Double-stranded RNA binding motif.
MDKEDYCSLIEQHSTNRNFDKPVYHFQQDAVHLPCNYYCSLIVCGEAFSTDSAHPSKKLAQNEAAMIACQDLGLLKNKTFTEDQSFYPDKIYDKFYENSESFLQNSIASKMQKKPAPDYYQQKQSKSPHRGPRKNIELKDYLKNLQADLNLKITEPTTLNVSSIEEIWKYMHGDVLAASFKYLLHIFAQDEQVQPGRFETQNVKNNAKRFFKTVLTFKNQTFESLGNLFSIIISFVRSIKIMCTLPHVSRCSYNCASLYLVFSYFSSFISISFYLHPFHVLLFLCICNVKIYLFLI